MGYKPPLPAPSSPRRVQDQPTASTTRDPRVTGALGYEKAAAALRPPPLGKVGQGGCPAGQIEYNKPSGGKPECVDEETQAEGLRVLRAFQGRDVSGPKPGIRSEHKASPRRAPPGSEHDPENLRLIKNIVKLAAGCAIGGPIGCVGTAGGIVVDELTNSVIEEERKRWERRHE